MGKCQNNNAQKVALCIIPFKGIVSPQNENSVINYSPSRRSKPLTPSFIFRTQMKLFLMKSESSQTLHRQKHNRNVPRSRNVVKTSVKQSMVTSVAQLPFCDATRILFFAQRKQKVTVYSTILLPWVTSSDILIFVTFVKAHPNLT